MIPKNFYCYKQMPVWNARTIPAIFIHKHNTKVGVYGKISVLSGKLAYTVFSDFDDTVGQTTIIEAPNYGVARPQEWHKVELLDNAEMLLEFFREKDTTLIAKEAAFHMTFPDKSPHFEVKYLTSLIESPHTKTALDIGSGPGRNALWLAKQGFSVHALDKNSDGLAETEDLAKAHDLRLTTEICDLNDFKLSQEYDVIISTVCLQFFEPSSAQKILQQAVQHTKKGGYNLIIVPIDDDDFPCPIRFANLQKYEFYTDFYKDWEIIWQHNDIGHFHKKDENGHQIKARFATILAHKPL